MSKQKGTPLSTPRVNRSFLEHNSNDQSINRLTKSHLDTSFNTPRRNSIGRHPKTPECFKPLDITLDTPGSRKGKVSKLDVAVRIRPMNVRELNTPNCKNVLKIDEDGKTLKVLIYSGNDPTNETIHEFHYDYILSSCVEDDNYASQEMVYQTIGKPLVDEAFQGYNACLFAYGQTGSGKSYSMMGQELVNEINVDSGIIPRFCRDLFDRINDMDPTFNTIVEISYFEIYNEKIHDLFLMKNDEKKTALKVREHPIWGPYVVDLSVHPVNTYDALRSWLTSGNKNRSTASTLMNSSSSRSHSIFNISLVISASKDDPENVSRRSKISFVDLAGSERVGQMTPSSNDVRLRQGVCINRSLLALGKVIAALSEQNKKSTPSHIPYRESVLTWLLRENLGGNSRTCMLATITPASCHLEETLSTLRYASQARNIVNRIRINEDPNERLIRELRAEVEVLRAVQQEYQRQELNKSQQSENTSMTVRSECIIENVNGRLLVQVNDLKENKTIIEDEIYLKTGDKLIINGADVINVEKEEIDEEEDKENETGSDIVDDTTFTMQDVSDRISTLEHYRSLLEDTPKVCSTPEAPNNLSPFRNTNFLQELEKILTRSPATSFASPCQVKTVFNFNKTTKSVMRKKENTPFWCIQQLQDISAQLNNFTGNKDISNAVDKLNTAIGNLDNLFSSKKKYKSVTFFTDY